MYSFVSILVYTVVMSMITKRIVQRVWARVRFYLFLWLIRIHLISLIDTEGKSDSFCTPISFHIFSYCDFLGLFVQMVVKRTLATKQTFDWSRQAAITKWWKGNKCACCSLVFSIVFIPAKTMQIKLWTSFKSQLK